MRIWPLMLRPASPHSDTTAGATFEGRLRRSIPKIVSGEPPVEPGVASVDVVIRVEAPGHMALALTPNRQHVCAVASVSETTKKILWRDAAELFRAKVGAV
jgi:hypothetical protein